MANSVKHYLRLLKAELEDLADELGIIDARCRERFEGAEITPYVFQENEALLKKEIDSIRKFSKIVDGIDASLYKNIAELEADLQARSRELIAHFEEPEAVFIFLKRKFDKIRTYLETQET
ncbi:MAG: hypothetical protein E4H20_01945 [Spirochaetales bacterium]|nr:MAG: hypothetical protein E4H20_01945 [Spirochaetales bacterium]